MSVDITTHIGIGWVISQEQKEEMIETAEKSNLYDEIGDSFHYINSYSDTSDVFFGEFIISVDAGDYVDLRGFADNFDYEGFLRSFKEVLVACGQESKLEEEWSNPKLYLINQLW